MDKDPISVGLEDARRFLERDDAVDNPSHYRQFGKEAIDIIRSTLTAEEFAGYCKGNELKYRLRAGFKDPSKVDEDMGKAMRYKEFRDKAKDLDGMENIMPRNAMG